MLGFQVVRSRESVRTALFLREERVVVGNVDWWKERVGIMTKGKSTSDPSRIGDLVTSFFIYLLNLYSFSLLSVVP